MGLSLKKPSRAPSDSGTHGAVLAGGDKRIVADVPERIHRALRLRCLERGISVREYILELLGKEGIG